MTYKEKLIADHPDYTEDVINYILREGCPHDHYIMAEDPEYCSPYTEACDRCWSRGINSLKHMEIDSDIHEEKGIDYDEPTPEETIEIDFLKTGTGVGYGTIKDSGDRTQFESGAVRDMHAGKGRMDLLPWAAIMEVSKHCENGAIKYGEHNVDKGIPTSSLCDSAARHLAKYLDGWTDEPHLTAAAWNLLWAIQMEIKNKEMVNTPWKIRDDITDIPQE